MNDVLYAIYDTGIDKTKDLKKKFKIVNLTSATEGSIYWINHNNFLKKEPKDTHGTTVFYAVTNRLHNLGPRVNKVWVQKIISSKLTFVDSNPHSFMPFGVLGKEHEKLQWIYRKYQVPAIPFLKKLTQRDALPLRESWIKTLAHQHLTTITNISYIPPSYVSYLQKEWSDKFSMAIDNNFQGKNQSILITIAAGNDKKTLSTYEIIHNNRHITVIGGYDGDYSTPGPDVFASGRSSFSTEKDGLVFGTSFAAPDVSSIAILSHQINPTFKWRDYHDLIANSVSLTKREKSFDNFLGKLELLDHAPIITGGTNWNGGGRTHTQKFGFGFVDPEAWLLLAASVQPTKATEKIITKQMNLTGTDRWSMVIDIQDNIQIEHIEIYLNATQQKTENITLFIKSPKGITYPILKPHQNEKQTDLNFNFLAVAARGEYSAGQWTLVGEGPVGSNWGNFQAGVNFYGVEIVKDKKEDINFTNDIASSILQQIDGKNGRKFENRLILNNSGGEKRINCASIYPTDLGDGTVKIDLNPGIISTINGQLVKIDPASQPINAAYGGGLHDILIGNQNDNELSGGPGDDYLDGGLGHDQYEISTYPFYDVSNHDIIDMTSEDEIIRKDESVDEIVFYETSQGQMFGLLGYHDTKRKIFTLSQNDSICLNLIGCSPAQLIFKDNKKTYSLIPLIVSYNQGKIKRTVTLWRPKASDQPPVVWLPHDAKNVQVSTSPTSKPLSYLDIKKAKFKLCSFQFLKTELVGTLSSSSQKEQYQGLLNNLLIEHGFKNAAKTEDTKIVKENRHWVGEKADLYLNLDQDPEAKFDHKEIFLKDILSTSAFSQRFGLKDVESIIVGDLSKTGVDIKFYDDPYQELKQTEFKNKDLERLQLKIYKEASNLSMTVHFKNAKSMVFTVNGSREKWMDPTTYKGYVYEQPPLINGIVLPSEQNYQGYYHVHIKLERTIPQTFAAKGISLERVIVDAKLGQVFIVTNNDLKITKLTEVENGFFYVNPGLSEEIQKAQELTITRTSNPSLIFSRAKVSEKDSSLAHIVKISNGDTHLMITTSVGLDTKPAPFDLKGFLVAHNLAK